MSSLKANESEPAYTKSNERSKYPFYYPNIDNKLVPETRELLEKYSHIPPEQQSEHIYKIRDQAWDIRAYPCIGVGAFLVPQLCRLPVYPEILARVKAGQTLMDVGTFIGHDLRRLAYDGAPSSKLYGVDIASHWDVGYEMFRDRDRFEGQFIESDILSSNPALEALKGKVDIILVSQVLHQWNWDGQVKAAKVLSSFTKPGSWVVGNNIGNSIAQEITLLSSVDSPSAWRHNPESWERMWNQVGAETGTKWKTQAWLRSFEEMGWDAKDAVWLEEGVAAVEFAVERIE